MTVSIHSAKNGLTLSLPVSLKTIACSSPSQSFRRSMHHCLWHVSKGVYINFMIGNHLRTKGSQNQPPFSLSLLYTHWKVESLILPDTLAESLNYPVRWINCLRFLEHPFILIWSWKLVSPPLPGICSNNHFRPCSSASLPIFLPWGNPFPGGTHFIISCFSHYYENRSLYTVCSVAGRCWAESGEDITVFSPFSDLYCITGNLTDISKKGPVMRLCGIRPLFCYGPPTALRQSVEALLFGMPLAY